MDVLLTEKKITQVRTAIAKATFETATFIPLHITGYLCLFCNQSKLKQVVIHLYFYAYMTAYINLYFLRAYFFNILFKYAQNFVIKISIN